MVPVAKTQMGPTFAFVLKAMREDIVRTTQTTVYQVSNSSENLFILWKTVLVASLAI